MIPPVCYQVATERTSPLWCEAFARGSGGRVSDARRLEDTDEPVALFGSADLWPLLMDAQRSGRVWYYGDHCYLGDTFDHYRITRNGYQVDGLGGRPDFARLATFRIRARAWRRSGRHVLICLQGAGQYALFGTSLAEWLAGVLWALEPATDRMIRIRSRKDRRPLRDDLRDCWAVVTWSSNAAVESLIAGVPVFVTAPWAASARMGSADLTTIERPRYPAGRETWLATLANSQWTLDEMRSGKAWAQLQDQEVAA